MTNSTGAQEAVLDLMRAARRVWNKYGHDKAGIESDWTEWTDLRDAFKALESSPSSAIEPQLLASAKTALQAYEENIGDCGPDWAIPMGNLRRAIKAASSHVVPPGNGNTPTERKPSAEASGKPGTEARQSPSVTPQSETPRTDALNEKCADELNESGVNIGDHYIDMREHARQLERELAECRADLFEEQSFAPSRSAPTDGKSPSSSMAATGGIYVASRVSRAPMWRSMRDKAGVSIVSTWIDEDGEGQTADFGELWTRLTREIAASTGLVFYADINDAPWKGALVEVGIALALGKPVGVVQIGEFEGRTMRPVGSWIHHPAVKVTPYIEDAIYHAQSGHMLVPSAIETIPHTWDLDGEHCLRCGASDWMAGGCRPDPTDYKALYHELLFAVARKYPDETRHQTALRYIRNAERHDDANCAATDGGSHG